MSRVEALTPSSLKGTAANTRESGTSKEQLQDWGILPKPPPRNFANHFREIMCDLQSPFYNPFAGFFVPSAEHPVESM